MLRQLSHEAIGTFYRSEPATDSERSYFYFSYNLMRPSRTLISDGVIISSLPRKEDVEDIAKDMAIAYHFKKLPENAEERKNLYQKIIDDRLVTPKMIVVNCTRPFESAGAFRIPKMADSYDWEKVGVTKIDLPIVDRTGECNEELVTETLLQVNDYEQQGPCVVLFHCKAGQARSVMVCADHLAAFKEPFKSQEPVEAVKNAYQLIPEKRPVAQAEPAKVLKAIEMQMTLRQKISRSKEIADEIKVLSNQLNVNIITEYDPNQTQLPDSLKERLDTLLASDKAKQAIAYLPSFREFEFYAAHHDRTIPGEFVFGATQRSKTIRDFFKEIYKAKNATWLINYYHPESHPYKLIKSSPSSLTLWVSKNVDAMDRRKMMQNLLDDVIQYACENLHCHEEELKALLYASELADNISPSRTPSPTRTPNPTY